MTQFIKHKLSTLCTKIGSGSTPRGGDAVYKSEGISLIRSQNILDFTFSTNGLAFIDEKQAKELANVALKERDVLLNITGDSVARVSQVPDNILPARVNQHVAIIRADQQKLNPEFLKYSLLSRPNKELLLSLASTGATRKAITKAMIEDFEIEIPDQEGTSTQTLIASILSSLDDKIELNRRTNQTLEQIAQTLFKKYFVDDIDRENLPEGWELKEMSKIISVKDGTHDSPKQKETGYYLITSKHIKDSKIDFGQAYLISDEDFEAINKRSKVDTFDILLTMIGTVGVMHLVLEENIDFAIKNIGLFKSSEREDLFEFLYFYLKSNFITEYLDARKSGSTQQYLTLDTLRNIPVLFPTSTILKDFKEKANPLIMKIRNNDNENSILIKLRDFLLPKLMSGEIEVNTTENELAEA